MPISEGKEGFKTLVLYLPLIALNLLKVCKKNILLRPVFAGNAICPQKCVHLLIKVCQLQVSNP